MPGRFNPMPWKVIRLNWGCLSGRPIPADEQMRIWDMRQLQVHQVQQLILRRDFRIREGWSNRQRVLLLDGGHCVIHVAGQLP